MYASDSRVTLFPWFPWVGEMNRTMMTHSTMRQIRKKLDRAAEMKTLDVLCMCYRDTVAFFGMPWAVFVNAG